MPSIYILKNENKKIYIGSCIFIDEKFNDHLRENTKSTKKFVNPHICWMKEVSSLKEARFLEKKIKKWKSRKMIDLLISGTINI